MSLSTTPISNQPSNSLFTDIRKVDEFFTQVRHSSMQAGSANWIFLYLISTLPLDKGSQQCWYHVLHQCKHHQRTMHHDADACIQKIYSYECYLYRTFYLCSNYFVVMIAMVATQCCFMMHPAKSTGTGGSLI